MSFHLIEDSSIEDIRIGFETKVIETALKVNGYKTEKKSWLQDSSGFSEPQRRARIFDEFSLYENKFLDLTICKKLFLKNKTYLKFI